jgi:hypothetical protein
MAAPMFLRIKRSIPTQVIKYNQFGLLVDQLIRLQYSHQIKLFLNEQYIVIAFIWGEHRKLSTRENTITKPDWKNECSTYFQLSMVVDRVTTTCCVPLHYIYLGCLPGCLPCQQIFIKTSKLSYYFYIVIKHVRYNNVNYFLISYSVECGRSWVRLVRIKPGICCFSDKHSQLRNKTKDWLARNQIDISEWSVMFSRGRLFQLASTVNIHLSVLV